MEDLDRGGLPSIPGTGGKLAGHCNANGRFDWASWPELGTRELSQPGEPGCDGRTWTTTTSAIHPRLEVAVPVPGGGSDLERQQQLRSIHGCPGRGFLPKLRGSSPRGSACRWQVAGGRRQVRRVRRESAMEVTRRVHLPKYREFLLPKEGTYLPAYLPAYLPTCPAYLPQVAAVFLAA